LLVLLLVWLVGCVLYCLTIKESVCCVVYRLF
jgi:hypothetical protein